MKVLFRVLTAFVSIIALASIAQAGRHPASGAQFYCGTVDKCLPISDTTTGQLYPSSSQSERMALDYQAYTEHHTGENSLVDEFLVKVNSEWIGFTIPKTLLTPRNERCLDKTGKSYSATVKPNNEICLDIKKIANSMTSKPAMTTDTSRLYWASTVGLALREKFSRKDARKIANDLFAAIYNNVPF
jgi:hypothetical protein